MRERLAAIVGQWPGANLVAARGKYTDAAAVGSLVTDPNVTDGRSGQAMNWGRHLGWVALAASTLLATAVRDVLVLPEPDAKIILDHEVYSPGERGDYA